MPADTAQPKTSQFRKMNEIVVQDGMAVEQKQKPKVGIRNPVQPKKAKDAGKKKGAPTVPKDAGKTKGPKQTNKTPEQKVQPEISYENIAPRIENPPVDVPKEKAVQQLDMGAGMDVNSDPKKKMDDIKTGLEEKKEPKEQKPTGEEHVADVKTPGENAKEAVKGKAGELYEAHVPEKVKDFVSDAGGIVGDAKDNVRQTFDGMMRRWENPDNRRWGLAYASDVARGIGMASEALDKGLGIMQNLTRSIFSRNLMSDPMAPAQGMVGAMKDLGKATDTALSKVREDMGIKTDANGNITYDPTMAPGTLRAVNYQRRCANIQAGEDAFNGVAGSVLSDYFEKKGMPLDENIMSNPQKLAEAIGGLSGEEVGEIGRTIDSKLAPYINGLRNKAERTEADRYMTQAYERFNDKLLGRAQDYTREKRAELRDGELNLKGARRALKDVENGIVADMTEWYDNQASADERTLVDAMGGVKEFNKWLAENPQKIVDGEVHFGELEWRRVANRTLDWLNDHELDAESKNPEVVANFERMENVHNFAVDWITRKKQLKEKYDPTPPEKAALVKAQFKEVYAKLTPEQKEIVDAMDTGTTRFKGNVIKYYNNGKLRLDKMTDRDLIKIMRSGEGSPEFRARVKAELNLRNEREKSIKNKRPKDKGKAQPQQAISAVGGSPAQSTQTAYGNLDELDSPEVGSFQNVDTRGMSGTTNSTTSPTTSSYIGDDTYIPEFSQEDIDRMRAVNEAQRQKARRASAEPRGVDAPPSRIELEFYNETYGLSPKDKRLQIAREALNADGKKIDTASPEERATAYERQIKAIRGAARSRGNKLSLKDKDRMEALKWLAGHDRGMAEHDTLERQRRTEERKPGEVDKEVSRVLGRAGLQENLTDEKRIEAYGKAVSMTMDEDARSKLREGYDKVLYGGLSGIFSNMNIFGINPISDPDMNRAVQDYVRDADNNIPFAQHKKGAERMLYGMAKDKAMKDMLARAQAIPAEDQDALKTLRSEWDKMWKSIEEGSRDLYTKKGAKKRDSLFDLSNDDIKLKDAIWNEFNSKGKTLKGPPRTNNVKPQVEEEEDEPELDDIRGQMMSGIKNEVSAIGSLWDKNARMYEKGSGKKARANMNKVVKRLKEYAEDVLDIDGPDGGKESMDAYNKAVGEVIDAVREKRIGAMGSFDVFDEGKDTVGEFRKKILKDLKGLILDAPKLNMIRNLRNNIGEEEADEWGTF